MKQYFFSGFNPHIASPYLFKEMWKFNLLTQRWSTVFTAESENMPEELVSNAVAIKDDIMLVSSPFSLFNSSTLINVTWDVFVAGVWWNRL